MFRKRYNAGARVVKRILSGDRNGEFSFVGLPAGSAEIDVMLSEYHLPSSLRRRFGPIRIQTMDGETTQLDFDISASL